MFSHQTCNFLFKDYMLGTQPAWDVFEMSETYLHWERHLKDLSETSQKRRLFWGVFKTSQIHLKKDVFFVTSLRRLKHISKKMFILWRLWYVSKINLESICDYSKISHKNVSCWRNRCVGVRSTQKMKPRFLGAIYSH